MQAIVISTAPVTNPARKIIGGSFATPYGRGFVFINDAAARLGLRY